MAVFALLLIVQERRLLSVMSESGQVPYLTWQLVCPVGSIALATLMPIRLRIAFLGLVGAFWSAVVIGDVAYFRFFGSVTSLVSAGTAHQLFDVCDSVIDVLNVWNSFYLVVFVGMTLVSVLPGRMLFGPTPPASFDMRMVTFRWTAGPSSCSASSRASRRSTRTRITSAGTSG